MSWPLKKKQQNSSLKNCLLRSDVCKPAPEECSSSTGSRGKTLLFISFEHSVNSSNIVNIQIYVPSHSGWPTFLGSWILKRYSRDPSKPTAIDLRIRLPKCGLWIDSGEHNEPIQMGVRTLKAPKNILKFDKLQGYFAAILNNIPLRVSLVICFPWKVNFIWNKQNRYY